MAEPRPMVGVRVEEELKERMNKFPKLNWSAILRDCIKEELVKREFKEKMSELKEMPKVKALKKLKEV